MATQAISGEAAGEVEVRSNDFPTEGVLTLRVALVPCDQALLGLDGAVKDRELASVKRIFAASGEGSA